METSISQFNSWTIIAISGEFVVKYLAKIREHLDHMISKPSLRVAFDLTQTSYIDSSALTLLLNFHKRVKSLQGRIAIFNASEDARAIFSIVGLDACIEIYDTREAFEKASAP